MIFEKLGSLAKNAANKTEDAIEIARLNSKINAENNKISAVKMCIGEYCWARYTAGASLDEEIMNLCSKIEELLRNIANAESEIQSIKAAATMSNINYSQSQQSTKPSTPASKEETVNANEKICSCGAELVADVKFCSECGCSVEVDVESKDDVIEVLCPNCGMKFKEAHKFCPSCGTKL